MDIEFVQNLLYSESVQTVEKKLFSCSDSSLLHLYAFNYNWDNGFSIPQTIINNKSCALGTALTIFYLADGYRYLKEKNNISDSPEWLNFIKFLYNRILDGSYNDLSIAFTAPLSTVQSLMLKKQLSPQEQIFIKPINGQNLDIPLQLLHNLECHKNIIDNLYSMHLSGKIKMENKNDS